MSYLLLRIDGDARKAGHREDVAALAPLDFSCETHAMMRRILPTADVQCVPGAVHLYRKHDLIGKLPSRGSEVTGLAFAVMARASVPLEAFLDALKVCEGKVRSKMEYFMGPARSAHVMKIDALCHDRAAQLCEILSSYEVDHDLLVVFPLVQSSCTTLPLPSWLDSNSEMSFSQPPRAPGSGPPALVPSAEGHLRVPSYTELPLCPSCLERLDASISGVTHMLCTHEGRCLCHFQSIACPVCIAWRLMHSHTAGGGAQDLRATSSGSMSSSSTPVCTPTTPGVTPTSLPVPLRARPRPECAECKRKDSLWACLTCGYIGCGRYNDQHTLKHCFQSSHSLVMELATQKIWDYDGDLFVHRILVGKGCKSVLPDQVEAVKEVVNGKSVVDAKVETKHEQVCLEFSYLLAQQLESGRRYHESRIAAAGDETAALRRRLVEAQESRAREGVAQTEARARRGVELERVTGAVAAAGASQAALESDFAAVRDVQSTNTAATDEVKSQLEAFLRTSHAEKKALDDEIKAAKDEVRDLEAAVDMRKKCKNVDAASSMLFVGEAAPGNTGGRKPKKRGKR